MEPHEFVVLEVGHKLLNKCLRTLLKCYNPIGIHLLELLLHRLHITLHIPDQQFMARES